MFAKLYETEDLGQILVKNDPGDDGPEIRFYFQPREPEGLGICSFALTFKDTDEGFDQADKVFGEINEAIAREVVSKALAEVIEATPW